MSDDEGLHDDDDKNKRWLEACRREEAIRALLKRHPDGRLAIKDVQDVAWELGVSRATLYRLITAYRSQGTVNSVKPTRRGRREGTIVLDRRRDQLIAKAINEIYLTPSRPTLTYLVEQIHARFAAKNWPLPDRRTIKARVDRIDLRKRALKRNDDKAIKATKAVPGEYSASRPLEIVQIDHTQADIFLVDEITRRPMQDRPWLTLAIDVFTRMITGFHLSLDPPFGSRSAFACCTPYMTKPPGYRSVKLKRTGPWPACQKSFMLTMAKIFVAVLSLERAAMKESRRYGVFRQRHIMAVTSNNSSAQ